MFVQFFYTALFYFTIYFIIWHLFCFHIHIFATVYTTVLSKLVCHAFFYTSDSFYMTESPKCCNTTIVWIYLVTQYSFPNTVSYYSLLNISWAAVDCQSRFFLSFVVTHKVGDSWAHLYQRPDTDAIGTCSFPFTSYLPGVSKHHYSALLETYIQKRKVSNSKEAQ